MTGENKGYPNDAASGRLQETERLELILHNDDIHSFDYVIETLINLCRYDYWQAEQCAIMVHYKGQFPVKTGTYTALQGLARSFQKKGLITSIE